jgi:hypothetical protein
MAILSAVTRAMRERPEIGWCSSSTRIFARTLLQLQPATVCGCDPRAPAGGGLVPTPVDVAGTALDKAARTATLGAMRVQVTEDSVEVLLSGWEKILGLLGNITVPCSDVSDVQVVQEPMREVLRTGLKAGLRLPGLYYVARTIRLDEAWLVRRGVPALSFAVSNKGALRRVVVSTPDAQALAARLGSSGA